MQPSSPPGIVVHRDMANASRGKPALITSVIICAVLTALSSVILLTFCIIRCIQVRRRRVALRQEAARRQGKAARRQDESELAKSKVKPLKRSSIGSIVRGFEDNAPRRAWPGAPIPPRRERKDDAFTMLFADAEVQNLQPVVLRPEKMPPWLRAPVVRELFPEEMLMNTAYIEP